MSTMTPKIVMFNMDIGDAPEETADGEEPSHNKLENMIKELSNALSGMICNDFILGRPRPKSFDIAGAYS